MSDANLGSRTGKLSKKEEKEAEEMESRSDRAL